MFLIFAFPLHLSSLYARPNTLLLLLHGAGGKRPKCGISG